MSFFNEISSAISDGTPFEPSFKATICGDKAVYLQGVKAIKSYDNDKIEVILKKGGLVIVGENLTIKKYVLGDLVVCGKIKSTEII